MNKSPTPKQVFSHPIHFLAFGFGTGLSPKAPGTVGTLVAIPLFIIMSSLTTLNYIILLLLIIIFSVYIAGESARRLGIHDHGGIVIDEICGYLVTMLFAPSEWLWIIVGFALFRLFDIAKPWPIRSIDQRLGGGLGIVLDDLMAGIYALLSLQLLMWGVSEFSI